MFDDLDNRSRQLGSDNRQLGSNNRQLGTEKSIGMEKPVSKSKVTETEDPSNHFGQNIGRMNYTDNVKHNPQKADLRPGNFNSISFHNFHPNNSSHNK